MVWVKIIKKLYFKSITDCARYFDCTISNISLRLEAGTIGKRGKTRGYLIEYAEKARSTYEV